jgi:hypothetical protein
MRNNLDLLIISAQLQPVAGIEQLLGNRHAVQYWSFIFQQNYQTMASWAYAWRLSCCGKPVTCSGASPRPAAISAYLARASKNGELGTGVNALSQGA